MVWNVVVRFFVVVLVGCGNWSACYCSSDFCARPILAADFFGDILCLLWCLHRFWFLAATPSVLFSLGGGPSYPGGASHKTKRRNPTSALIRPTLTKLAHCDCTVKEGATHQDVFEGDVVVGELDKFLSRDGGVGSHLGFVNRYLQRKHQKNIVFSSGLLKYKYAYIYKYKYLPADKETDRGQQLQLRPRLRSLICLILFLAKVMLIIIFIKIL